jgi:hypothetical protein
MFSERVVEPLDVIEDIGSCPSPWFDRPYERIAQPGSRRSFPSRGCPSITAPAHAVMFWLFNNCWNSSLVYCYPGPSDASAQKVFSTPQGHQQRITHHSGLHGVTH